MKINFSNFLSVFLSLIMVFSIIPVSGITAYADTFSGTYDGSDTWVLDTETGVLTISGEGAIPNYSETDDNKRSPWYSLRGHIKSVVIGSGVVSIGNAAFYDCSNLESVSLPNDMMSIGGSAFYGCESLKSITIPYGVQSINTYTFIGCTSLTEISIPETVTLIENSAFRGCKSLTNIKFPNSLESIAFSAFWGCESLTDVVLPESVTFLGGYAFRNCKNLKTITIPAGVEKVQNNTFTGCTALTDIYYGGTLEQWYDISSFERENVTIHCGGIEHDHEFPEWSFVEEPTCDDIGLEYRKCESCTLEEIREVPATGHDYVIEGIPPTCTQQGYTKYKCSICGDSYTTDAVEALGHTYNEGTIIAPTCTGKGSTRYDCLNCQYFYQTDYVDALGHKYETVVKEPTCTEEGYVINICTVCGFKDNVNREWINATGHNVDTWERISESTCTVRGMEKGFCSNCNQYVYQYDNPLGHNYSELKVDYEATCTKDGRKSKECLRCGNKTAIETIPALGHSYSEWKQIDNVKCGEYGKFERVCLNCGEKNYMSAPGAHTYTIEYNVVEPTCTTAGSRTVECSECGKTTDEIIPAKGHSYTSEITKPATQTTTGIKTYTCKCGDTYTEVIDMLHTHKYESVTTAPTCTEKGYTTYTCECGDTYTEAIDMIGHNYASVVTEPTCTEQGYTTYTCECGDSYVDDYVDASGHKEVRYPEKAPTCTKEGYTSYVRCRKCGEYMVARESIPALGHDFTKWTIWYEPTCTEYGEEYRYCNICGDEEFREIDMIGHNYESVVTVPTCTEKGYTTYTCSECEDSYIENYVDAVGHTIKEYEKVIVAPICTGTGLKEIASCCTECDGVISKEIVIVDASGHTPAHFVYENAIDSTCTQNGSVDKVVYCSVCNEEISRETVVIDATGHADNDGNGYCDADNELLDPSVECDCNCHKSGISNFFFKFLLFFQRIFGTNKTCDCGVAHY